MRSAMGPTPPPSDMLPFTCMLCSLRVLLVEMIMPALAGIVVSLLVEVVMPPLALMTIQPNQKKFPRGLCRIIWEEYRDDEDEALEHE